MVAARTAPYGTAAEAPEETSRTKGSNGAEVPTIVAEPRRFSYKRSSNPREYGATRQQVGLRADGVRAK